MTSDERLEALERRLAALEGAVRSLAQRVPAPAPVAPLAHPVAPVLPSPRLKPAPRATVDSEQWLGQRGLLALGVFALILAAGYFLKLAFDRGWISPIARCVSGAAAGFGVAVFGWRLHGRGMRSYGAALIGAGAAIAYLALWAATRLFGFLPATGGIATLCGLSLWLALVAYLIDVEWLGATAALGGLLAPIFLDAIPQSGDVFLAYLAALGLALGWVASLKRWRHATAILALACFGLLPVVWDVGGAHATSFVLFGAVVGGAGVYLGLRERWRESRFLAFAGGWAALGYAGASHPGAHLSLLAGAIALSVPVWRIVWNAGALRADAPAEAFYFLITPALLVLSVRQADPALFLDRPALATAVVALGYLLAGYVRTRPPFALAGALLLLVATLLLPPGVVVIWLLLVQTVLWSALDHSLDRWDGRWHSLPPFAAGLILLLAGGTMTRPLTDPAFTGVWAAALWASVATASGLALGLWKREVDPSPTRLPVREVLWCTAGGLLFIGVTAEILRFYQQSDLPAATRALAGGLTASAWWLAFAAGLAIFGFRRRQKPVRVAGLMVAGLAAVKVVLVDLSSLDALYRVASILILGVVSLGIAYLYNRKGDAG